MNEPIQADEPITSKTLPNFISYFSLSEYPFLRDIHVK